LDSVTAVLLGALTFVVATIGINIVANFVPPAFDITNIAPNKISWRAGGDRSDALRLYHTLEPFQFFSNPAVIHYTIDILACANGPLYGILLVDYYVIKKEQSGRSVLDVAKWTLLVPGRGESSAIGFTFTMGASLQRRPDTPRWRLLPYRRPNL
jgi:Permease for cytosine/purines, uracil, thiamine, allantoin